jgi:exodeoxyribonuclease (lambda-induced)
MKIHRELEQKSWDWFKARAGKVTGSELKNLITDKLQIRKWTTEMPNSYLHRKLAEKWRGQALQSFGGNQQTDQGVQYEERARKFFASLLEKDIETVGGIESDDGKCWCSPDGIIGDTTGLEIKCPNADTHIGWLLGGCVPEEHVLQVQFSLWVSEFKAWWFMAWCKDFPHLAIAIEPDDSTISTIKDAVGEFNDRMDAAFEKLVELNGGPPPPVVAPTLTPGPIKFSWEQNSDIVP